jgi:hypothetical protein
MSSPRIHALFLSYASQDAFAERNDFTNPESSLVCNCNSVAMCSFKSRTNPLGLIPCGRAQHTPVFQGQR